MVNNFDKLSAGEMLTDRLESVRKQYNEDRMDMEVEAEKLIKREEQVLGANNVDLANLFKNLQHILSIFKKSKDAEANDGTILAFSDEMGSIWQLKELEAAELKASNIEVGNEAE